MSEKLRVFVGMKWLCLAPLIITLVSCEGDKEDPELRRKYDEQKALIDRKKDELDRLQKDVQDARIPDPTESLTSLKEKLEASLEEKKAATKKIGELKAEHESVKKKLELYRKKYPIRN